MFMPMPALLQERGVAGLKWVNMFGRQQPGYPPCSAISSSSTPRRTADPTPLWRHRRTTAAPRKDTPWRPPRSGPARRAAHGRRGLRLPGRQGLSAFLPRYSLEEVRLYDRFPAAAEAWRPGPQPGTPVFVSPSARPPGPLSSADIV